MKQPTKYQILKDDFEHAKQQLGIYFKQVKQYEKALNEIDTHIRATPEPIPYIVETLKNTLPYYKVENYK